MARPTIARVIDTAFAIIALISTLIINTLIIEGIIYQNKNIIIQRYKLYVEINTSPFLLY